MKSLLSLLPSMFLLSMLSLTSCSKSSYDYYYLKLGELDCKCASALELSTRHLRSGSDDTLKTEKLRQSFENAVKEYDIYVDKHWDYQVEIDKKFSKEKARIDYLKGYAPCNLDTCLFKQQPQIIKAELKSI